MSYVSNIKLLYYLKNIFKYFEKKAYQLPFPYPRRNILILKDVLMFLQDKKSKLTLYTYDAFVFDFDKSDGKETLESLEKIMNQGGKYPIKFKYSSNLVL